MKRSLQSAIVTFLLTFSASAYSLPMAFSDRASFDNELSHLNYSDIRELRFEDSLADDVLPSGSTLNGIRFTYFIDDGSGDSMEMKVSNLFDTTSGNKYLGLDDAGNLDQFVAGDEFTMNLGRPYRALGMYFVTSDPLFSGDILLETPVETVLNSELKEDVLADGGIVYFLGLVSPGSAFDTAHIRFDSVAPGTFLFNVDDIVTAAVPEPGTTILMVVALFGLRRLRKLKWLD